MNNISDFSHISSATTPPGGVWEQLFHAIQDPVMVVRPDGIIIEANPATMQAARKNRELVYHSFCKFK